MRRRRMGSARHSNEKYGAVTTVLVFLLVAAFIFAFQSLGIYDLLFNKPAFNNSSAPGESQTPNTTGTSRSPAATTGLGASSTPAATAAPSGDKITEEIKMNAVTLYGVQLGVYTKQENADTSSAKFKKDGSAGYILKEDTLFRVVDSVYYSESDAKALRDEYRKGFSPDACILKVEASGINWKVSATRNQIDAIKGAVTTLQSQLVILINTQKGAQQKQGTAGDWKLAIGNAAGKLKEASERLTEAVGSTNSEIINKLNSCLKEGSSSLETVSKLDTAEEAALISGLKYSIIDILLNLQKNIMG